MATTKVFKSGNSLAVRLPRDIAFPEGAEVVVSRQGESLVVSPARLDMKTLVSRLALAPSPPLVQRPEFKPPKRDWSAGD
ncbi:antitoxin [Methylocystis parvus]|uniref:AbrB/MazE/SpoVT family DNA-binding domain-containing protein n=1 Tax=Methylocystis parvus TaxID=134 RepID=A0A6B8M4I0_9HYPH|nr:AbrB/MazE/SpoVT family DNA-binding domain-containing protein [Methylocystis parvus]QGM97012.1 AbrB/MazE/SpoVT family DNA-binding domain-containing protein [Methylocystis parvus]WBJ99092.1 AbrB/MazE/SpoVT family DNA-binding domain-containing protein [Methylocystis parvus OBBP]